MKCFGMDLNHRRAALQAAATTGLSYRSLWPRRDSNLQCRRGLSPAAIPVCYVTKRPRRESNSPYPVDSRMHSQIATRAKGYLTGVEPAKTRTTTLRRTVWLQATSNDPYEIRTHDLLADNQTSTPDWTEGPGCLTGLEPAKTSHYRLALRSLQLQTQADDGRRSHCLCVGNAMLYQRELHPQIRQGGIEPHVFHQQFIRLPPGNHPGLSCMVHQRIELCAPTLSESADLPDTHVPKSEWRGSNPRPPRPERGALPSCATFR